jgi:hypothetical protein
MFLNGGAFEIDTYFEFCIMPGRNNVGGSIEYKKNTPPISWVYVRSWEITSTCQEAVTR